MACSVFLATTMFELPHRAAAAGLVIAACALSGCPLLLADGFQIAEASRDGGAAAGGGRNESVTGATCEAGSCGIPACPSGFADCDPDEPGCETDTRSSEKNCGGCGESCKPGAICARAQCVCAPETPLDCGALCGACCDEQQCDDHDPCTDDRCDETGRCVISAPCASGGVCCDQAGCQQCCADADCPADLVCRAHHCEKADKCADGGCT